MSALNVVTPSIARIAGTEAPHRRADSETLHVSLADPLATITGRVIAAVLAAERGHKRRAAARLGVSLRTVQRHVAAGRA